jgi:CBS domain-containing protein
MLQNNISGLPVVDAKGNLLRIVTEDDFLRRSELGTQRHRPRWLEFLIGPGRLAAEFVRASGRKVGEIMTPDPYTMNADTPLEEVVQLMERHRIKRLPVVEDGKPIGMVSRANLLHALASFAR